MGVEAKHSLDGVAEVKEQRLAGPDHEHNPVVEAASECELRRLAQEPGVGCFGVNVDGQNALVVNSSVRSNRVEFCAVAVEAASMATAASPPFALPAIIGAAAVRRLPCVLPDRLLSAAVQHRRQP